MTLSAVQIDRRYQLNSQIGRGGMGIVYQATDRLTGDKVALKQVKRASYPGRDNTRQATTARAALMREFRIAATLRHPHVISVLDYGVSDADESAYRYPYFTMRLLDAPRLITEYAAPDDVATCIRLMVQMLTALGYLHQRGVIHRDLKPSNVLVEANGEVQMLDFGLASLIGSKVDEQGGTIAYMAPELLDDGAPGVLTDLYAVGVIAYEMFAGQHPFNGTTLSRLIYQVTQTTPDWEPLAHYDVLSGSHPTLRQVIAQLMHRDPAQRYPDAWAAIEALCAAVGLPVPPEDETVRESFLQAATFVGREQEMGLLRGVLEQVQQTSRAAVWLVGGVSGVGKSRLLDELRIDALVSGWQVLRGESSAEHRLPYQLWREPLRGLILGETLTAEEIATLKPLLPELDAPGGAADAADGSSYITRLVAIIGRLMAARSTPLLLILEDLHWAGNGLDLLGRIMPMVRDKPILIIGSYRDDEAPDLPRSIMPDGTVTLPRFAAPQIAALSASMLGEAGRDRAVIELVERETEGNAFFMVEVIRALAQHAGTLRSVGEVPLPERVFTGGVREAIGRRISRLPAWALPLMHTAALVGRAIDLNLLRGLSGASVEIDAWLTAGANVGVLEIADERWRFSHDQVRDMLVSDLSDDVRRHLHIAIVDGLEQVYPGDARYAEASFEHLLAAGEHARAVPYALSGARAALRIGRYDAVRRIGEAALNIDVNMAVRCEVLLLMGEAALYQGDYRETERITRGLLEALSADDPQRPAVQLLLGRSLLLRADYVAAHDLLETAHTLAEAAGAARISAGAIFALGQVAERQGESDPARAWYEDALVRYRALDDISGIADSLHGLATLRFNAGDYAGALASYQESLALRQRIGDPRAIASSLNNIGGTYSQMGLYDDALASLNESLRLRRAVGEERGIAMSLINIGHVLEQKGELAQAFEHFSESYERFNAIGARQGIAIALNNLASNWERRGEYERARHLYSEALEAVRVLNDQLMIAHALHGLAGAYLALGDAEAALACAEEEIPLREKLGDPPFLAKARQTRADALRALGRADAIDATP
jgi:tetratricopeptide (TPR) repeat protein